MVESRRSLAREDWIDQPSRPSTISVWSRVSVPHTVLIVDDSPTAAPELRALLESSDYQVQIALRADEALQILQDGKIDLVITETLLPGTDGFELVRKIRQEPAWAQLPIIMLTVRSAPEDYAAGFEAGANEYFIKPMEPPKMLAAARGLLTRFESGRLERPGAQASRGGGVVLRPDRGEIITVFSLKGGGGTTTIAVNLAVAIKQLAPSSRVGVDRSGARTQPGGPAAGYHPHLDDCRLGARGMLQTPRRIC